MSKCWCSYLFKRCLLSLWFMLSLGACVYASAAAPSQEFWEYMADFSDENGDVIDPLELDEVVESRAQMALDAEAPAIASTDIAVVKAADTAVVKAKPTGNAKKVDLNMSSKSSVSSGSHKEATL